MSDKGVVLVLGGGRSGKSDYALGYCAKREGRKAYLATAQAFDHEMEERIAKHRESRSKEYVTLEEPLNLIQLVQDEKGHFEIILLDCLTLWITNLLEKNSDGEIEEIVLAFIDAVSRSNLLLVVVSNEVGMSIIPENALARRFRDLSGKINQLFAKAAKEVYLVTAGIPLQIK